MNTTNPLDMKELTVVDKNDNVYVLQAGTQLTILSPDSDDSNDIVITGFIESRGQPRITFSLGEHDKGSFSVGDFTERSIKRCEHPLDEPAVVVEDEVGIGDSLHETATNMPTEDVVTRADTQDAVSNNEITSENRPELDSLTTQLFATHADIDATIREPDRSDPTTALSDPIKAANTKLGKYELKVAADPSTANPETHITLLQELVSALRLDSTAIADRRAFNRAYEKLKEVRREFQATNPEPSPPPEPETATADIPTITPTDPAEELSRLCTYIADEASIAFTQAPAWQYDSTNLTVGDVELMEALTNLIRPPLDIDTVENFYLYQRDQLIADSSYNQLRENHPFRQLVDQLQRTALVLWDDYPDVQARYDAVEESIAQTLESGMHPDIEQFGNRVLALSPMRELTNDIIFIMDQHDDLDLNTTRALVANVQIIQQAYEALYNQELFQDGQHAYLQEYYITPPQLIDALETLTARAGILEHGVGYHLVAELDDASLLVGDAAGPVAAPTQLLANQLERRDDSANELFGHVDAMFQDADGTPLHEDEQPLRHTGHGEAGRAVHAAVTAASTHAQRRIEERNPQDTYADIVEEAYQQALTHLAGELDTEDHAILTEIIDSQEGSLLRDAVEAQVALDAIVSAAPELECDEAELPERPTHYRRFHKQRSQAEGAVVKINDRTITVLSDMKETVTDPEKRSEALNQVGEGLSEAAQATAGAALFVGKGLAVVGAVGALLWGLVAGNRGAEAGAMGQ